MEFEVCLERVEPRVPCRAERAQPRIELLQRFGPQAVEALPGARTDVDETCLAQHLEVLRHVGLGEGQLGDERPDRPLAVEQEPQDFPSAGVGEDLEDADHTVNMLLKAYVCQDIWPPGIR